jgi:predicted permease
MMQDLRFAARALRRAPGFAATVIATLALGLGVTTAIFTVSYGVLLRPLPYGAPDGLVVLLHDGTHPVSPADFLDYKRELQAIRPLSAAQWWEANLTGSGQAERLRGLQVSSDLFDTLQVAPLLGRAFVPGEEVTGSNVVVLSHALWTRRFAADPAIVGRAISLDRVPHVVIGVMPASFHFAPFWATRSELWKPLSLEGRLADRDGRSLRLFGRLSPGATQASAQAEASVVATRLAAAFPDSHTGLGIGVVPLHEKTVGPVRPLLTVLAGMAGFVLLISCANVSSLLLARASARHREMAVRTTLGASHLRLVRQLLAESLVLSTAGGIGGALLASIGISWLAAALPPGAVPRQHELSAGHSLLLVAGALIALATVICGMAPVLHLRRAALHDVLKDSPRGATEGRARLTTRRALVALQMALALAVVVGAGLMGRTFVRLQALDPGFDPRGVLTAVVSLSGTAHTTGTARLEFFDRLAEEIEHLPGVEHVSAINHLPLAGDIWRLGIEIDGRAAPRPGERASAAYRVVRPGYFRTMGLPLRRGRDFARSDGESAPAVVIVNEAMARRHWPGEVPLDRRIRLRGRLLTVVGVAADARQDDWTSTVGEEMYVPYAQHADGLGASSLTWVVRTTGEPERLAPLLERTVWSLDPDLPVSNVATMAQVIGEELWRSRTSAALLTVFAAAALALSAMGVYGLVAYTVSRRTREIGIRMALGARRTDVVRLASREALVPAIAGACLGVPLALLVARSMSTLMYEIPVHDPGTFTLTAVVLTLVALTASVWPALEAGRVDPIRAMRDE